jgi:DNA-binding winged helix-turn-helix (wHTH) protein/Tol biopolymer transport system component
VNSATRRGDRATYLRLPAAETDAYNSPSEGHNYVTTRESLAGEPRRRHYRFGEFVLDLDGGFLRRNGDEVPLRPKSFEVLTYLVLHHGRLISKDELVKAVWSDAAVTDNSLSQCLFEIRRALEDERQKVIRTVARRGYVFDALVSVVVADFHRSLPDRAALALEPPLGDPSLATAAPPAPRPTRLLATGLVIVIAGLGGMLALRGIRPSSPIAEPPVQLTNFNDSAIAPALSHDGRMLTFLRGGGFGRVAAPRGQVYVKLLPNAPAVQLTRDGIPKDHPVFSPDDSRIVYTAGLSGLRWDSWQVPVLGGTPQPFLPNASGVVWLDKRRLVYSTIMSGIHMGIASSTESRSEYREIYFPDRENGMAHRSAPSPDGHWLLVVEMTGGTWQPCRLVRADGSSAGKAVSPPGAQCTSAAWSPDGRWMYFSSNAGGAFHIWRQRFPDGEPEQITFGPTEQEGTAITPDGKYLITSMGLQQASIWLHDAAGERKLTDEGWASQPAVSPLGDRMFYLVRTELSRGQASGELWSVDLKSGERRHVLPGMVMANYSLSHDGKSVVFTSSHKDRADGIWIADLERRAPPRHLVRGAELRAFFGAPGEIVYTGEDSRLYRMREDGSSMGLASPDRVSYLSTVSPDGRWAVAILPRASNGVGTTSLWFVSLRGEKSIEVCNEACGVGPRSFLITAPFAWTADAKWLFVNLVHFGMSTARTVVLPYRADQPVETFWPKGLRFEQDVAANPGARAIDEANTFPALGTTVYLSSRTSTQSNLYRIRIPE